MSTAKTSPTGGNTRTGPKNFQPLTHIKRWCAIVTMACATPLLAQQALNIPAQQLSKALKTLGEETGLQIVYDAALVSGKTSKPVQGVLESGEALRHLLQGTGLTYTMSGNSVTLIIEDGPVTLKPVKVTDSILRATTEGTGSYTTGSTNTAARLPLSLRETPQSVSVFTRQRMDDQGIKDLADVLRQTPGVYVEQSGSLNTFGTVFYSRGFEIQNYQVDGVRRFGTPVGGSAAQFFNGSMASYDRVEIVRGATGLMNGSGTPAATVNLIRKRPGNEPRASITLEAGSWDYYRAMLDVGSPLDSSGAIRGRAVASYQDSDYFIDRQSERLKTFYGVLDIDITPSTLLSLGVDIQNYSGDALGQRGLRALYADGTEAHRSRSESSAASWAYTNTETKSYFTSLEHRFANGWQAKVSYERTDTEYDEVVGFAAGFTNPVTGQNILNSTENEHAPVNDLVDVYTSGEFNLLGRAHEAVVGASYSRVKNDSPSYYGWWWPGIPGWNRSVNMFTWDGHTPTRPVNTAIYDYIWSIHTKSAYGTLRFNLLDNLSLIAGARVTDYESRTTTDYYNPSIGTSLTTKLSESGEVTPYLGLVYDFSDHWSAYASYTDIFEAQSYQDPEGTILDPLTGMSYELGIKGEFFDQRLNVAAAVYRSKQDNFALDIPGVYTPTGAQAYRAVSGVESEGYELEVNGRIAEGWELSFSYSHNETEDRNGEPLATWRPENQASLFSTYNIASIGNGLTVGGGARWQDTIESEVLTFLPGSPVVKQGAYTVVDLMARYPITDRLKAAINIRNAFDKRYYQAVGSGTAPFGEPRSVRFSLTIDL